MKQKIIRIKFLDFFMKNNLSRTSNLKNQIGLSFIFKLLAIGFNFLLVPVTLKYLGKEQYGIWMTILTILSWISFCDMGIGNGMRNKVTESLAMNDYTGVKKYVSSAYVAIGFFVTVLYIVISICSSFVDWQRIFNVTSIDNQSLNQIILLSFFILFINFLLSLINQVINAYQQSSMTAANQILANGIALFATCILLYSTDGSILLVAAVYGLSLIIANIVTSWIFYNRRSEAKPSFHFFEWKRVQEITGLSIKFFIIQLAAMVFFAKDNVIITQVLGPEYVTTYSVVFKLFSVVTFAQGIILAPLWSAYTDAYAQNDFEWINRTVQKMKKLMIIIVVAVIVICLITPSILYYWLGSTEGVELSFVWLMGIFVIISAWNNTYAAFLNGTGKLRLTLLLVPILTVINIPLAVFMTKLYGLNGILFSTIICMIPGAILQPIQYLIIIRKRNFKSDIIQGLFLK